MNLYVRATYDIYDDIDKIDKKHHASGRIDEPKSHAI